MSPNLKKVIISNTNLDFSLNLTEPRHRQKDVDLSIVMSDQKALILRTWTMYYVV